MSSNNNNKTIVYIFCGQIMKYYKSYFDLYDNEIIFKETIDLIDLKLKNDYLGYSIWNRIKESNIEDSSIFKEQILCNTILFMTQVSIYKLYKSYNILPDYVIPISLGEIAASYVTGILPDLDTALYILINRALLLNKNIIENVVYKLYSDIPYTKTLLNEFPMIELGSHTSNIDTCIGGLKFKDCESFENRLKKDNIKGVKVFEYSCFHHSSIDNIKNEILNLKFESSSLPNTKYMSCHNGKLISPTYRYNSEYLYTQMRGIVDINTTIKSLFNDINSLTNNNNNNNNNNNTNNNNQLNNIIFVELSPISNILKNIKYLIDTEIITNNNHTNYNIEYYNSFYKNENMYESINNTINKLKKTLNI